MKKILDTDLSDHQKKVLGKFYHLNQGNLFMSRKCAQSIPRIKLPPMRMIFGRKIFDFRFTTPTSYPESGSRTRFHAPGMRTIDFPYKITPNTKKLANWKKILT
jgi:hypothetical protein